MSYREENDQVILTMSREDYSSGGERLMMIHIHRIGSETSLDISTPRVTVSKDGARYDFPGETVLIVGTRPNLNVLPMSRIESFWVEED